MIKPYKQTTEAQQERTVIYSITSNTSSKFYRLNFFFRLLSFHSIYLSIHITLDTQQLLKMLKVCNRHHERKKHDFFARTYFCSDFVRIAMTTSIRKTHFISSKTAKLFVWYESLFEFSL